MGISDWSSDVCASDRVGTYPDQEKRPARHGGHAGVRGGASLGGRSRNAIPAYGKSLFECTDSGAGFGCSSQGCQGSLSDRKSGVKGKSVSDSLDLVGRRIINKKNTNTQKITPT